MATYRKLSILKFGTQLIETGDLDPVYTCIWRARLERGRLKRLLLAYWWFYHLGVACKLSKYKEDKFYQEALKLVVQSGSKAPRGSERRHFRGEKAKKAIQHMSSIYPEAWIDSLYMMRHVVIIVDRMKKSWPMFGPWIGFKAADMLERLNLIPITFSIKTLDMYKEPTAGAKLLAESKAWKGFEVRDVVEGLIEIFNDFKAPPRFERPIGVQEVETILCKWKSHMNGHYPLMKDTKELDHSLRGWGKLAERMRGYLHG